ncbi:MAG: serine/threonine-protein kinase [Candidatus Xenobia bacterium]
MLQPGDRLAERYQVERVLGRGGMGGVYLGMQIGLGRKVAIKQLIDPRRDPVRREASARQFRTEAQLLSQLRHPGLPEVYDYFQDGDDHFLVMEYIDGHTLEEEVLIRGELSEGQVLPWIQQLCEVLRYLHSHQPPVVFRDLKPSNVMVGGDSRIRLIDFGIAKIFDGPDGLTQTGARGAGTPGFAAPEQYESTTDFRSDIYSLGATLYFLLTRQAPPNAVSLAMQATALMPLRALNPHVSETTAQTVAWMMAIRPAARPTSVAEVMDALGLVPGTSRLPVPLPPRPSRRLPKWFPAAAGGALALLAFLHWALAPASTRPGHLTINSVPDGATVRINDRVRGITPLTVDAPSPGTYEIHLTLPDYQPASQVVTVRSGDSPQVTATLQPGASGSDRGTVVVKAAAGSYVRVDGQPVGRIGDDAMPLALSPGVHRIGIGHPGNMPALHVVTVEAGQSQDLDISLHPLSDMAIEPGVGVGPFKIGLATRDVPQAVGGIVRMMYGGVRILAKPAIGLGALPRRGQVELVLVATMAERTPEFATSGGVHVGSNWSEVEAEFGSAWQDATLPVGQVRQFASRGIAFAVDRDTVSAIVVGAPQR